MTKSYQVTVKLLGDIYENDVFSADQNVTTPKVQGLISLIYIHRILVAFDILLFEHKRACIQNIELNDLHFCIHCMCPY